MAGNRVADVRRGLGMPDYRDLRQASGEPVTAGEIDQALAFRKRMLADRIISSTMDELEGDADLGRLRLEEERVEHEYKILETRAKLRELKGASEEAAGSSQVTILQNVIGLLGGDRASLMQQNQDLQNRMLEIVEQSAQRSKDAVVSALVGGGAPAAGTFADRITELLQVRQALQEIFPTSGPAQAEAKSVSEAIQLMHMQQEHERFMAELRRKERNDQREEERKMIALDVEDRRAKALTDALERLPAIATQLMNRDASESPPAPAPVPPVPMMTPDGMLAAGAPALGLGLAPGGEPVVEVQPAWLPDGGFVTPCPRCQSPVRFAKDQTLVFCPGCREKIQVQ